MKVGVSGILEVDGKILLGLRDRDDESLPGLWCTPGGGVEESEDLNTALRREFREEVGLDVIPLEMVSVQERFSERGHTILIFKTVAKKIHPEMAKALDGFEKVAYYPPGEILCCKRIITPMTYAALMEYFRKTGRPH